MAYWALPAGVPIMLVEDEQQLDQAKELLEAAVCCAIDAEWPPEETTEERAHRGGPPQATLVQLALWLPPGAAGAPGSTSSSVNSRGSFTSGSSSNGGGSTACKRASGSSGSCSGSGGCCVVLLDMICLPQEAAKQALQALFRNKGCLKLGFGLVHDMRAMGAALGSTGGSCIAVVEPACDVGTLHRFLRHRGVPGVHKTVDLGLSGLVEAQLGAPLDKQQQCSAWGERPLSAEQLAYAAADAACLLGLLGSLVHAVGQPEEWPMAEAEAAPAGLAEKQGEVEGEEEGGAAQEQEGQDEEASGRGEAGADGHTSGSVGCPDGGEASGAGEQANEDAAARQQAQQAQRTSQHEQQPAEALLAGCSAQQLRAAAAAWGVRLEISGAKAVKRGSRRSGQRRRQQQRAARGRGALPPGCSGFPLHVPWMDGQRQLTGAPRFLCDVMVEGLARQLRLCGFDAESLQESMEKAPRHACYRVMTERGEGEGRVVLTRDRTYVGANYSDQAFLVTADTKQAQLQEILSAFGLTLSKEDLLTRCARCNGEFLAEPFPATLLPEGHGVPPGILEKHTEFWVCARCQAVFWQGSQYSRAKQQVCELIDKFMAL